MTTTPEELDGRAAPDVGAEKIARVYAEALLNEALKQNLGSEILEDLEALQREVLDANLQLEEFLIRSGASREQKAEVIKAAFEGRAPEILVNFLYVLNDHDRLDLLPAVIPLYRHLLDEHLGRIRVRVRSARPLTDEQMSRLYAEARALAHREPILETEIDPRLLGGLQVRVGDWLYDASVRIRLETLRDQLLEKGRHEIQSGRDRFSSATTN